jgi:hypothetical protein
MELMGAALLHLQMGKPLQARDLFSEVLARHGDVPDAIRGYSLADEICTHLGLDAQDDAEAELGPEGTVLWERTVASPEWAQAAMDRIQSLSEPDGLAQTQVDNRIHPLEAALPEELGEETRLDQPLPTAPIPELEESVLRFAQTDRRSGPRVPWKRRAQLDIGGRLWSGPVRDISVDGLFVEGPRAVAGAAVEVEILGMTRGRARGRVVRNVPRRGVAIQLTDVDPQVRAEMVRRIAAALGFVPE